MPDMCELCDDSKAMDFDMCYDCSRLAKALLLVVMELEDRNAGNNVDLADVLDMALDGIGIKAVEIENEMQ